MLNDNKGTSPSSSSTSSSFLRKLTSSSTEEDDAFLSPRRSDVGNNFVYGVTNMRDALKSVMSKIGAKGLAFEETSMSTDDFREISQIVPRTDTLPPNEDKDHLYLTAPTFLTSFLAGGYHPPRQLSDGSGVNTKISWTQSACACRNNNCTETVAIDPIGFFDTGNGFVRGRAPIVFIGDDGELMPCLKQPTNLPPIDHESITLSGGSCAWTNHSITICDEIRKGVNSTFKVVLPEEGLPDRRCVECSTESSIDGLRVFHEGKLIARAFNSSEILSSELSPDFTLYDLLDDISFPNVTVNYPLTDRTMFDFTEKAKELVYGSVTTTFNGLLGALSPRDFDSRNSLAASNASIAEMARVIDSVFQTQLIQFSALGQDKDIVSTKMESLPIHITKQIEHPEESLPQEIVNGITLLLLASCAFGAILGSFIKNNRGRYLKSIRGLSVVFGSLVVLLLEASAFYLGWIAEDEHIQFSGSFVHMEVKGSQRFTVNPLGNLDMKGAPFIVHTHVVEVSDAGENFRWLYTTGMFLSMVGLLVSAVFGPIFEGGEKERHKRNKRMMRMKNREIKKDREVKNKKKNEDYDEEENYKHDGDSDSYDEDHHFNKDKETDSKCGSVEDGDEFLHHDSHSSLTNRKSVIKNSNE